MADLLMLRTEGGEPAASALGGTKVEGLELYGEVGGAGILALDPTGSALAEIDGTEEIRIAASCGSFGATAGPYLFCVAIWTPDDFRTEFLDWYESEHFPMLVECPQWDGGRLVEGPAKIGSQFYALHNLAHPDALDSDARKRSRSTDWFNKLAENNWFDTGFVRTLYARPEA